MKQLFIKEQEFSNLKTRFLKLFSKESLIALFAATIYFREFSAIFLVALTVFFLITNSINIKQLKKWKVFLLAAPLLVHILFLWNNESLMLGLKQTEKYLSFLLLPLLLSIKGLSYNGIIFYYSLLFGIILSVILTVYLALNFEQMILFIEGKEVWRMGYSIAKSFGSHAPALNMHISLLAAINYHLLLNGEHKNGKLKFLRLALFLVSIIVLLLVNTRLSIALFIIYAIVSSLFNIRLIGIKKTLLVFGVCVIFLSVFPHTIFKITNKTFNQLEYVGKLDELPNPEGQIYGSLVTRVTVWKETIELANKKPFIGYGASDSYENLFENYRVNNQKFLYKHKYKVHNQFLDFYLKFGILGPVSFIIFISLMFIISIKTRISYAIYFSFLFFSANLFDDFMIRYDGIVFSLFWTFLFFLQNPDENQEN